MRRLIGKSRDGKSLEELRKLISNRETRLAVLQALREQNKREPLEGGYRELLELLEAEDNGKKRLEALDELAWGKEALAESIVRGLDLTPALAVRGVNRDERMVLNFWGLRLCVLRGVPNISHQEKVTFLEQYSDYVYFASRPEGVEASAWATVLDRLTVLSRTRYQEFDNAFNEMVRKQEADSDDSSLPAVSLSRAITKNLLGLETDILAIPIQLLVTNRLTDFATTFGTPENWATMRNLVEQACRELKTDAKVS